MTPGIPEALSMIVMRLLRKPASERYRSAHGLRLDLEECRHKLARTGVIDGFTPGQYDISSKFRVSDRLYGRDDELARAREAFDRARAGAREFIVLSGPSGAGRGMFLRELAPHFARHRALYATAAFDSDDTPMPYAPLLVIFRRLVQQVLADGQLSAWRRGFQEACGDAGQLLLDVIPELEHVIGPQPPAPPSGPLEVRARFFHLVTGFLRVFASVGRPLVLFVGELQWAGRESLALLEHVFTTREGGAVLVVAGYRGLLPEAAGSLARFLAALREAGRPASDILLGAISVEGINGLVADTLRRPLRDTLALARLVHRKSHGNHGSAAELLETFYRDGLIEFDRDRLSWSWNLKEIERAPVTDDVATELVGRLDTVGAEPLEVLGHAACTGRNRFSFATLSLLTARSPRALARVLAPAVEAGLISLDPGTGRFFHVLIRQGAYARLDPGLREHAHAARGRQLLAETSPETLPGRVFEVVDHLNKGRRLLEPAERLTLATLNYDAGQRAREMGAHDVALRHHSTGLELLAGASDRERRFKLMLATAECEFLTGDLDGAERRFEVLTASARGPIERADVAILRVKLYNHRLDYARAIEVSCEALSALGFPAQPRPSAAAVMKHMLNTRVAIGRRAPEELAELPELDDPRVDRILRLALATSSATFVHSPNLTAVLAMRAVTLCVRHGINAAAAYAITTFGIVVGGSSGDRVAAESYARASFRVLERFPDNAIEARVRFLHAGMIGHWTTPLRELLRSAERGAECARESGSTYFESYTRTVICIIRAAMGESIPAVKASVAACVSARAEWRVDEAASAAIPLLRYLEALAGDSESLTRFAADFDEEGFRGAARAIRSGVAIVILELKRLHLLVLARRFEPAAAAIRAHESAILETHANALDLASYYTDVAITYAGLGQRSRAARRAIKRAHKELETMAEGCPANFRSRADLARAELAAYDGDGETAIIHYERAVRHAREQGCDPEEALALECAGEFYRSRGAVDIAHMYLRRAREVYARWGAHAKTALLDEVYPELAQDVRAASSGLPLTASGTTSSSGRFANLLDLSSVMKATRAVAGELRLGKLLTSLMEIVIENAGADRGWLLWQRDGGWFVEAEGALGEEVVRVQQGTPIAQTIIPPRVVEYVGRTREIVVLENPAGEGPFTDDPQISLRRPRSAFCMPMLHQGRLTGVLYLENRLVAGAFTGEHRHVLELIASDAAVAIEVARLYEQLEEKGRTLEQRVRQRTAELSRALDELRRAQEELVHSEKMAALGQLVAGIAHEVNTPLGAIQASISNIRRALERALVNLPRVYEALAPPDRARFQAMVQRAGAARGSESTREARRARRRLARELAGHGVAAPERFAEVLVEIGIHDELEPLLPLLRRDDAELVLETAYDLARQQQNSDNIQLAVERASKIIFALKRYVHRGDGNNMVLASVTEGVDLVLTLYRNQLKRGVEVVRRYEPVPEILCAPDELYQVWTNLIHNAIQAMDYSGTIELRVAPEAGAVAVHVIDSGPGIPAEILGRIFDPFFTTKRAGEGSGLGLDITRRIVERHDGHITVESRPGRTAFVVRLPTPGDETANDGTPNDEIMES
ncbi:MAG: AAA family ATPase [Myxococcales bacterium]|nr:AAA family ATPase [Myxococcales bacterium]